MLLVLLAATLTAVRVRVDVYEEDAEQLIGYVVDSEVNDEDTNGNECIWTFGDDEGNDDYYDY